MASVEQYQELYKNQQAQGEIVKQLNQIEMATEIRNLKTMHGDGKKRMQVQLAGAEQYSGVRGPVQFRGWTKGIKNMADQYSKVLKRAMLRVEVVEAPIQESDLNPLGVAVEEDRELRCMIIARTAGEGNALANNISDQGKLGLEIWRATCQAV